MRTQVISFAFMCLSASVSAQFVEMKEIGQEQVPGKVVNGLNDKYNEAKVKQWYKVGANTYEVYIKHEKEKKLITFDWEGRVGKELIKIKKWDLPDDKKDKLMDKYENLNLKKVYRDPNKPGVFIVEGKRDGTLCQIRI